MLYQTPNKSDNPIKFIILYQTSSITTLHETSDKLIRLIQPRVFLAIQAPDLGVTKTRRFVANSNVVTSNEGKAYQSTHDEAWCT